MGLETHYFALEGGAIGKEFADFFYPISILDKEAIYLKSFSLGIKGITINGASSLMLGLPLSKTAPTFDIQRLWL